jgi:hypothetical protein
MQCVHFAPCPPALRETFPFPRPSSVVMEKLFFFEGSPRGLHSVRREERFHRVRVFNVNGHRSLIVAFGLVLEGEGGANNVDDCPRE